MRLNFAPGRAALAAGLAVAAGLIAIAVTPPWIGWPLAVVLLGGGYLAALRLDPPAPTAGTARSRPHGSIWLGLLVLSCGGVWLTEDPPEFHLPIVAVAAATVVLASLDRRTTWLGGGVLAATAGYGAVFLGLYRLMVAVEPAMIIASLAGVQTGMLARDQLSAAGPRRAVLAVVAALIGAQTTLLLAFLPVAAWAEAGLALIVTYCVIGIMSRSAEAPVTRRIAVEYALVLLGGAVSVGVFGR